MGLGARLVTVHASGGRAMLEAAQDAAGPTCGVLAVTVLTSLDNADLAAAWGRTSADAEEEALRLAGDAAAAGLHGVVCSGAEARAVHQAYGDALAVLVPGVRLEGDSANDQQRVVTPLMAQRAGARYVVIGADGYGRGGSAGGIPAGTDRPRDRHGRGARSGGLSRTEPQCAERGDASRGLESIIINGSRVRASRRRQMLKLAYVLALRELTGPIMLSDLAGKSPRFASMVFL